jgi:acyl-CoA thioester hydrolase
MALDANGGSVHVWPVRVYYEDTDAAGIVYYANYLKFAERARTELLRSCDIDHSRLADERGLAFAVRDCRIEYHAPARLDDALEVRTRVLDLTGAAVRIEQSVHRDAEALAHMEMRIVCVRADGRPARLPAEVKSAVAPFQAG